MRVSKNFHCIFSLIFAHFSLISEFMTTCMSPKVVRVMLVTVRIVKKTIFYQADTEKIKKKTCLRLKIEWQNFWPPCLQMCQQTNGILGCNDTSRLPSVELIVWKYMFSGPCWVLIWLKSHVLTWKPEWQKFWPKIEFFGFFSFYCQWELSRVN